MQDSIDAVLKGKFLNDDIYVNLNSKVVDSKSSHRHHIKNVKYKFSYKG